MAANVMAMGSSGIGSDIQSGRTECQGRLCDRREAGLLLPIAVVGSRIYYLLFQSIIIQLSMIKSICIYLFTGFLSLTNLSKIYRYSNCYQKSVSQLFSDKIKVNKLLISFIINVFKSNS